MASHGLPAQAKATPRPDPLLFHPKATYVGGLASFPGKAFLNTFCDGLWEQRIGRQTFEVHVVTGAKPCGSVVSQRRRGRRHSGASPFYIYICDIMWLYMAKSQMPPCPTITICKPGTAVPTSKVALLRYGNPRSASAEHMLSSQGN